MDSNVQVGENKAGGDDARKADVLSEKFRKESCFCFSFLNHLSCQCPSHLNFMYQEQYSILTTEIDMPALLNATPPMSPGSSALPFSTNENGGEVVRLTCITPKLSLATSHCASLKAGSGVAVISTWESVRTHAEGRPP